MEKLLQEISRRMAQADLKSKADCEEFKREILGKNGLLQSAMDEFRALPGSEKPKWGSELNRLKSQATEMHQQALDQLATVVTLPWDDITLPSIPLPVGSLHPLTQVENELTALFNRIGFRVATGPEIEDDWHNFTALNFPENHPARDMQDTFFMQGQADRLLRTHTSGVQIRTMLNQKPPIRVIAPGRVYRCDNDATHSPVFHQIEGLVIDTDVSFAHMKEVLYYFVDQFFGKDFEVRFRPSFFPFTEPSAEMDIGRKKPDGEIAWMEILGCGLVDPAVLENCNIDPEVYSGYAFGIGIDRLAMLKYQIPDIRLLYENDVRFLRQF
jgi:phenylalanyl-tRNA synthetase alpha chain